MLSSLNQNGTHVPSSFVTVFNHHQVRTDIGLLELGYVVSRGQAIRRIIYQFHRKLVYLKSEVTYLTI